MNQQTQNTQVQQTLGLIADAEVFYNREREIITHRLSENIRIVIHENRYKQLLGIPFTKKEKSEAEMQTQKSARYGLFANPDIYLSKDKQFVIHKVLGVRIVKHVNFYKKILGVEFTPKAKSA